MKASATTSSSAASTAAPIAMRSCATRSSQPTGRSSHCDEHSKCLSHSRQLKFKRTAGSKNWAQIVSTSRPFRHLNNAGFVCGPSAGREWRLDRNLVARASIKLYTKQTKLNNSLQRNSILPYNNNARHEF